MVLKDKAMVPIDFPLILFYNIFCRNVVDNWVINAGEASYEGEE